MDHSIAMAEYCPNVKVEVRPGSVHTVRHVGRTNYWVNSMTA